MRWRTQARAMKRFFAAAPAVKAAESAVASCPAVGPTPVRLGWRRPSAAKELWRTFRGCDAPFPAAVTDDEPQGGGARFG